MSGKTDLIKLYSGKILALAADIPHAERLGTAQASVKKRSPLCGSMVTVDLDLKDGVISAFGQDVKACALGQASASVVGGAILGTTPEQLLSARDQLRALLNGNGVVPDSPFQGFEVFLPASAYKNRHASILLSIEAACEAIDLIQA
ncbi:MAG TPA: iron-sulfur cluster assembly scaffold protein [Rhodobacteraceae bacterium]|jgi:NifU-like protein involved in Fe-S cluster formation|uniref:iron-sulfur cluster assembly scaffold protein n=2 Tax=Planktotalea sp. TaxID=2029877 RepID=UPI000ED018B5|nr:iron-sulfur cluster assembly scaffold protein [Planktotalea sp.]MDG1085467.1 iron-sulfur cluster assembly scaffold protein [Planktotalea sp.]HCW84096.1 iron-sulfur cluster assembly scaffold protein [Paracoccaceae bacterium]